MTQLKNKKIAQIQKQLQQLTKKPNEHLGEGIFAFIINNEEINIVRHATLTTRQKTFLTKQLVLTSNELLQELGLGVELTIKKDREQTDYIG
jgi:hypothetical protein